MFKNFFILFLTVLLLFACSKKDNAKIVSEPTDEERAVEIYSEAVEAIKIGDDFCYSANGKELWGENHLFVFFLLSFGALFGDMVASFYKRRQNLQRGDKFQILYMYDFVFMSLLLCLIFQRDWLLSWFLDGWRPIFTILVLTPFLHRGVNIIGYKLGVKKEPW